MYTQMTDIHRYVAYSLKWYINHTFSPSMTEWINEKN